jgi:hypothetical protein
MAALLRPRLGDLAKEICAEIHRAVPEYDPPGETPFRSALESAVEQSLTTFVDRIVDPSAPLDRLAEVCRTLGQSEAYRHRSLNSLQSAYRTAFRIVSRRSTRFCARHEFPSEIVARLAEAQLEYMDELLGLSVEGYLEVGAQSPAELDKLRRQLLGLIFQRPQVPLRAITELAERANWPLPAEVTAVAVRPGLRWSRTTGDKDLLLDLDNAEPRLLAPGPLEGDRLSLLKTALPKAARTAVGLTVPLEDAADSLRWARRALTLVDQGIIDDAQVTLCEDHLFTLWLMSEPALIDELARRRLGELAALSSAKREALTETLRVWLESWSTAAEVGDLLHVHPQTVRYRMHQIKESLGDRITDPEERFGLELALRAKRLRDRAPRGAYPTRPSRAS